MVRYILIKRWTALLVLAAIAPALGGQPTMQAATDEQKAKPDKADKYIEQQRQEINFYYENQLDQIRANKADVIRRLDIVNPVVVSDDYLAGAEYIQKTLDLRGIDLFEDWQYKELFRELRDKGINHVTSTEKLNIAPELLAIAEDRYVTEENRALRGYDAAEMQLERERNEALNIRLSQSHEQSQYSELNPMQAKPAGLISGILYCADRPAAIVGSKIVYQQDKLGDVRVVKINVGTVEFDKNGRTWTQKIGETPSSSWQ